MKTKAIWQTIAQLNTFSVAQVALSTHIEAKQVRNALNRWLKLGYIKQVNRKQRNKTYRIIKDNPPRFGQGNHSSKQHNKRNSRQQIWNTLKMFKNITLIDILVATDSGKSSARDYLNALERCGYLKGVYPINQPKRWVLLKNTGGIAPANIRGIGIFDKNVEQLIPYITMSGSKTKPIQN